MGSVLVRWDTPHGSAGEAVEVGQIRKCALLSTMLLRISRTPYVVLLLTSIGCDQAPLRGQQP